MKDPKDLAQREERTGRDLDNDQERGESARHKARVLGDDGSGAPVGARGQRVPPRPQGRRFRRAMR